MVFSSHLFLFYFLPGTLLLYYVMPPRGRHVVLALLSYLFYGWANPLFVVLLLTSTVIDYFCGLAIVARVPAWVGRLSGRHYLINAWHEPLAPVDTTTRTRAQRGALLLSVCTNLSLLGYFKYINFASDNINALADLLGAPWLRARCGPSSHASLGDQLLYLSVDELHDRHLSGSRRTAS